MRLLLSENLPLRTTRQLGDFASDEVLPIRIGDLRNTRFPLRKLTDTDWLAADHPMPITAVYVDDEATAGFDVQLRSDNTGNTWTVVRLAAPAPPDAKISASGIGVRDPTSGELINNPAAIAEYVLRRAGRSETFPLLRAECAANDIVLAGSLDRVQAIRAWVDEIMYSSGAMWTPEAARLYPTTVVAGYVAALDRFGGCTDLLPKSNLDDTADILRVSYDLNDATGRPQQFVELTASPQRFGGLAKEVTLRWLRKASNAEAIGRRMLQRMAGVRYSIEHETDNVRLRPCTWTRLVDNPQWMIPGADPTPMILSVTINPDGKTAGMRSEFIASTPTIEVTAHSIALPSTITAAVSIAITDGVATFTITDDNGKPVKDALCSLDGGAAKKTNEEGKVAFSVTPATPPKKHQLVVQAPGMTPFLMDFLA